MKIMRIFSLLTFMTAIGGVISVDLGGMSNPIGSLIMSIIYPADDEIIIPVIGRDNEPEIGKTVEEVIRYYGYPVETHTIQSEDGYLLKVQRIPYGKEGQGSAFRQPIFLEHGLFANAACWIFNTPSKSLAFILADNGFDVWIGNMRGTPGTEHVSLTREDKKFWRFSWEQMANYDLPATFDHILNKTGAPTLSYVGHSLGTTVIMALLSTKTEYNDKMKGVVLLAPAATLEYVETPIKYLAIPLLGKPFFYILNHLDDGEFDLSNSFISSIKNLACSLYLVSATLCKGVIYFLFGPDDSQLDHRRIDVYVYFLPQTTSVRNFQHVVQLIGSKRFTHYDFGSYKNLKKYGQTTPPEYDVSKIRAPLAIYSGLNDWWAQPEDVNRLASKLPNLFRNVSVNYDRFSHLDFLWAENVNALLYDQVLDTLKAFP